MQQKLTELLDDMYDKGVQNNDDMMLYLMNNYTPDEMIAFNDFIKEQKKIKSYKIVMEFLESKNTDEKTVEQQLDEEIQVEIQQIKDKASQNNKKR